MTALSSTGRPPVRGVSLHIIRTTWMVCALLVLILFVISLPSRLPALVQLPQEERQIIVYQLGLPVEAFALYLLAMDVVTLLIFILTAAVLYWQKSDDWVVFAVSLALLTFVAAINPSLDVLSRREDFWRWIFTLVRVTGAGSALLVLYIFPNGKFVPRWSRGMFYVWAGWLALWLVFASQSSTSQPSDIVQGIARMLSLHSGELARLLDSARLYTLLVVLLVWFGTGIAAQIHRYRCESGEAERQQTRWILFSLVFAFVGYFAYNLPQRIIPEVMRPGYLHLLYIIVGEPIYLITLLLVPLFLTISIMRHRLWDIDFLINRTIVYGVLTSVLGFLFFGSILVIQRASLAITGGENSPVLIAASTLVIAALFLPLKGRLQNAVDRLFYREKIDFRQAFTSFSSQVRTIIEMPELLHVLVQRTTHLYHASYGAVYLCQADRLLELADAYALPANVTSHLRLEPAHLLQLQAGNPVARASNTVFPILVPLMAPHRRGSAETGTAGGAERLQGVLALGPRLSGLGYFREDTALLMGLADQAGTAIYVARLIQDREAESHRREDAERQLAEYHASPAGQAEILAQHLIAQPETVLPELYQLTQKAGQDPETASLLANLSNALGKLNAGPLTGLAEGFYYLHSSQFAPELTQVGLRTLITQLVQPESSRWQAAGEALELYRLCQSAIDANSIAQITGEKGLPSEPLPATPAFLHDLDQMLRELQIVVNILRAYERVDTSQDKLAYLASAVDRLRHVDRFARADLGSADRALVQRIASDWLAIVTGAISDLQARAHLVCQLVTRHTWQDDVISLVLGLHNEGRGSAMKLRISLAPDANYTLIDEGASLDRLPPGGEAQVQLRVRPHLGQHIDQFRARFVILYTDPRGSDQVENFADVVHLMSATTDYQFIPNPYVVGTPLQAGSPLFFGRSDVVAFIQENLAAAHRNNLVLIGQRRTGKTSLLKQLPVRLGDEYLPVYLDGQALGLDPGLPNFFLTLATEIAFAMEDRGFAIRPPEMSDFAEGPAAAFERGFLVQVRHTIGTRHLLLMLDEFEELESAVRRGDLESSIFGFLRHLIQHSENLSVIFCGTHRLEELAADYWNVLFNISLYRHIALLSKEDAFHLVQEPVASYGMHYDDLALDKMWRVTAGHPYFLQLLCHSLVNRHNRTQRTYVTVGDVNAALDEILASGEAHFVYLWTESTPSEKLALTALSRLIPLTGHTSAIQVVDYLEERGITIDRQAISEALHHLALRDVLTTSQGDECCNDEEYHWELGLLGLWVEKYKSLNRVVDEIGT